MILTNMSKVIKKKVKAWMVVHKYKDTADQNCILEVGFADCGTMRKPRLKDFDVFYNNNYRVVPCEISYKLSK